MPHNPVVIITGAGAGIGAAIVDTVLEKNANVVAIDLAEEPLKHRQATVGSHRFQYVVGDVSHDEVNSKAVDMALVAWGTLDGLALNAGIMSPIQRIAEMSSSDVRRIFDINVIAHISMLSVAIPHLRKSHGRVIFTSSDAGEQLRWKAWGAYGATKAAVNFFVQSMTLEEPNIIAIGLYPGIVNTPLVHKILVGEFPGMTAEEQQEYIAYAKPKLVEPQQPGSVIARLALGAPSDLRGFIGFWNNSELSGYRHAE